MGDHLSWPTRYRGAHAADPGLEEDEPPPFPSAASGQARKEFAPAWPCSRWGLPGRRPCGRRRWSLTPPFHPDRHVGAPRGTLRRAGGRFLWPDPRTRSGRVRPPGGYPAPCSTERGLSSDGSGQPSRVTLGRPRSPGPSDTRVHDSGTPTSRQRPSAGRADAYETLMGSPLSPVSTTPIIRSSMRLSHAGLHISLQ